MSLKCYIHIQKHTFTYVYIHIYISMGLCEKSERAGGCLSRGMLPGYASRVCFAGMLRGYASRVCFATPRATKRTGLTRTLQPCARSPESLAWLGGLEMRAGLAGSTATSKAE